MKKQGILPLTFVDESDYDKIEEHSKITTKGIEDLAPGSPVSIIVTPLEGKAFEIPLAHSMSKDQIEWFKAGSALNLVALGQN